MWLLTKHGFYSMIQRAPGVFHVRARERRDLQNLIERVPLTGVRIRETPLAEYRYHIVVCHVDVLSILEFLGRTVNYDNFKAEIDRAPDQARKRGPYHEIWAILAAALGAYGLPKRKPSKTSSRMEAGMMAAAAASEVIRALLEDREHATYCDVCSIGEPCDAGSEISRRAVNAAHQWMSTDFGWPESWVETHSHGEQRGADRGGRAHRGRAATGNDHPTDGCDRHVRGPLGG